MRFRTNATYVNTTTLDAARRIFYETTRDKINTRENSTLVIATVASSASLILLTTSTSLNVIKFFDCYALLFAFLGILYREITIFFSDKRDYAILNNLKRHLKINVVETELDVILAAYKKKGKRFVRGTRSFIFRFLLAVPIIIFLQIKGELIGCCLGAAIGLCIGILAVSIYSIVLVIKEDRMIFDC